MIPNRICTFVNLLADHAVAPPMPFWQYVCLRSMWIANRPERLTVYYGAEPMGLWWEEARKFVVGVQVPVVTAIYGRALAHHAHRCDVMRLQALLADGGIYFDLDTFCVRPVAELLHHAVVMGRENDTRLCNATILASAGHPFLAAWLATFQTFDGNWNSHACEMPTKLAPRFPEVTVVQPHYFFFPDYFKQGIAAMHERDDTAFPFAYSHHLWHSLAVSHLTAYTPERLLIGKPTFCRLVRQVLGTAELKLLCKLTAKKE